MQCKCRYQEQGRDEGDAAVHDSVNPDPSTRVAFWGGLGVVFLCDDLHCFFDGQIGLCVAGKDAGDACAAHGAVQVGRKSLAPFRGILGSAVLVDLGQQTNRAQEPVWGGGLIYENAVNAESVGVRMDFDSAAFAFDETAAVPATVAVNERRVFMARISRFLQIASSIACPRPSPACALATWGRASDSGPLC